MKTLIIRILLDALGVLNCKIISFEQLKFEYNIPTFFIININLILFYTYTIPHIITLILNSVKSTEKS